MTALPHNVVPMPGPSTSLTSLSATQKRQVDAWSESWHDEPGIHLPDPPDAVVAALPAAIAEARRSLAPGDPAEVLAALTTLAVRRGFAMPDDVALEMDVEILASWPRDLWRLAFRRIWENFAYRRMPEVADFRKTIEAEMAERQDRLARLETLRLKLETARLRHRWNEETRRRHRRSGESIG